MFLILNFTLWHWHYFLCNSVQLDSNSQIATVWGYALSILPPQDTHAPSPPPLKIVYPPLSEKE